jgi:hypothetical protein
MLSPILQPMSDQIGFPVTPGQLSNVARADARPPPAWLLHLLSILGTLPPSFLCNDTKDEAKEGAYKRVENKKTATNKEHAPYESISQDLTSG